MDEKNTKHHKKLSKFDLIFFSFSAVLILILSIRLSGFHPINLVPAFVLLACAPFLFRYLDKNYGEEKKFQSKLELIDTMSDKELAGKIASIYTGRGFSIDYFESDHPGVHMICQRKGVRNGEDFIERGVVLVFHSDQMIDLSTFEKVKENIRKMGATQGMIVTNSRFSPEILDLSKDSKIALWGRTELREKFHL